MAEPRLIFGFSHMAAGDTPWGMQPGETDPEQNGWMEITPTTDLVVFTGGGILGTLPTPTCASGTRDATIRPSTTSYVIPQTFVEKDIMYHASRCGHNANRYAMGVYIDGHITSDLYLEAWDDNSFSTTNLELLTGTPNSGETSSPGEYYSYINAIRTTLVEPPWDMNPSPGDLSPRGWDGSDNGAAFLRGTEHRIGLNNTSSITETVVYYNIYIRLETDCSTFHAFPVLGFRYLYT